MQDSCQGLSRELFSRLEINSLQKLYFVGALTCGEFGRRMTYNKGHQMNLYFRVVMALVAVNVAVRYLDIQ
jgi:hypothetical protein